MTTNPFGVGWGGGAASDKEGRTEGKAMISLALLAMVVTMAKRILLFKGKMYLTLILCEQ